MYLKQDSLGLKSWLSYAVEIGVASPDLFAACVASDAPKHRILAGLAIGKKFEIQGTPTVIVNGWRYANPTDVTADFGQTIELIRQGKAPFERYESRRF